MSEPADVAHPHPLPRRIGAAVATILASALLLVGCPAPAADEAPSIAPTAAVVDDAFTPVLGETLSTPRPLPASDGHVHLAYEMFLSNVTTQVATIQSIDVLDGNGRSLERLDGDSILPWVRIMGATEPGRVIGPGQGALVWIDIEVDSIDALPASLTHDITFAFDPGSPPIITAQMTERLAPTLVDATPAIVIAPPLEGEGWFNGNGCCAVTPHRDAINAINGRFRAPERYAIDYVRLSGDGTFYTGPVDELTSYPYYGAHILAVGDGPIISMRFDLPEQTPGANPTGLTLDEYGGNHIVQDLGNGVYAFYAHLQTGNPLGVAIGQELKKGDVIGLLGNSGNTDSPHLHFHLMDSASPLGSNGIPFVYDTFALAGSVSTEDFGGNVATGGPFTIDPAGAGTYRGIYPMWLTITDYPG